jgi:hypothetical protein
MSAEYYPDDRSGSIMQLGFVDATEGSFRVRLGKFGAFGSSLPFPNERTSSAKPVTSETCQQRKWEH